MRRVALYPAVFVISAVGIAYQVALMRVFTIGQWHHFAYMVISIAMLGFGASGTALSLARPWLTGRETALFGVSAAAVGLSFIGCYVLSQYVPFETFQLVTQPRQIWLLLLLYLILALPFFFVATCIMLAFMLAPGVIGRIYAVNMAGSGAGALAIVGLLYAIHPRHLPYVLALAACVPVFFCFGRRIRGTMIGMLTAAVIALVWAFAPMPIRVSEYKGLSYAMQMPDAEIVATAHSPMSAITAVSSEMIRETPGQISNYPMSALGELPPQIALFFDAGGSSTVNAFDGSLEPFSYLDYVTGAAAYRVVPEPQEVLIVGAGGGTDVLGALWQGADNVTAIEVDPRVFPLMRGPLAEFSGNLYARPDVTPLLAEGRGFLQSHEERFDLIQIALLDSFNAAAAGVHALNESYLYTVDALALYLDRLTPRGALAITRWIKTPPRDALKMFATAVDACRRAGIDDPAQHLVFLRSWNTATIILAKQPLSLEQIEAVKAFCHDRWFDLCHYPGITPDEVNRFILLERPVYYEFAQAVLSGDPEPVYDAALFNLRPATDDRPYFFRFFKWSSLPLLVRGMGSEWVPFVEWGYLALVATLVQSVVAAAVLILLPLIAFGRVRGHGHARRWTLLYFAALGLAFMFLEIAFIQRFMLFLAYPIYAVTVVLTAFLIFSGLGSLVADRVRRARVPAFGFVLAGLVVVAALYMAGLPPLFNAWAHWPDLQKIVASILLLAPLAFLMGFPFPLGLQTVADRHDPLLPWAWGINGCTSVTGAVLATFIAVHLGFRLLVLIAICVYGVAWLSLWRLAAQTQDTTRPANV